MTTVGSKVTSEHGNLANGGISTVKHCRIYVQKLPLICQSGFVILHVKPSEDAGEYSYGMDLEARRIKAAEIVRTGYHKKRYSTETCETEKM